MQTSNARKFYQGGNILRNAEISVRLYLGQHKGSKVV